MKKYIISILVTSIFLLGTPFIMNQVSAQNLSIRDFINLLVAIGVIGPEKIPTIQVWLSNYEKSLNTQTVSSVVSQDQLTSMSSSAIISNIDNINSVAIPASKSSNLIITRNEVVSSPSVTNSVMTNNNLSSDLKFDILDLGKWIDSRKQESYYAVHNSLIRDDIGRMHMTYCSSGEPFNPNQAPDWRQTAKQATDSIRYQFSDNNGQTWSNAKTIISAGKVNGQENLYQGACSNTLIYFQGKYYIYFESYTDPSGILSIYVARANEPAGPYEIWTNDGWKTSPTNSVWKPVIKPNILTLAGHKYIIDNYKKEGQDNPYNLLYGAGLPRGITQKDGKIYLYYIDTTYWFVWVDQKGIVHNYNRTVKDQIPYQLVAIGDDPTNLSNVYNNRMVDSSGTELWSFFSPKYFPAQNKFYNFMLDEVAGKNKILYRSSDNGIIWSDEKVIGNSPVLEKLSQNVVNHSNNIIEVFKHLISLSDKNGYGKLSDLYLTYSKEFLLPNGPVGWKDTPAFKWYHGGSDIYGIKLSIPVISTTSLNDSSSDLQINNVSTPIYPSCGSAEGIARITMPVTNLCSIGTLATKSGPTGDGSRWVWGCVGQNTGWPDDTTWCFAPKLNVSVYPSCGSAANVTSATLPTSNLCSIGTLANKSGSTEDGTNRWFWGCVGQNTGWADDTAWCFAPKAVTTNSSAVIYPACGTSKNTCSIGIIGENGTTADGTNRWFWACIGQNTGWADDTAWCFAPKTSTSASAEGQNYATALYSWETILKLIKILR